MKRWLPFLLVPISLGAGLCFRTRAQSQNPLSESTPSVHNQAELDAYLRSHPEANADKLGHAYSNAESRLYWNTDWEAAKREAAREGKPILALRLLGNLSDEYSCANSRFFRVLFYPQQSINARLRRDFVLYWSSERPVPTITIDMGDGRIIKRTITGNSAHYVLDATGRPLDVYPGLSSPKVFENWLTKAQKLAQDFKAQPSSQGNKWLATWHANQLRGALKNQMMGASPALIENAVKQVYATNALEGRQVSFAVPARTAATLAVTKMAVEAPMLNSFGGIPLSRLSSPPNQIVSLLDEATRNRIRALHPLMATAPKSAAIPNVQQASLAQTQKVSNSDARFDMLIRNLEGTLLSDTLRNQGFSVPIHALFAQGHEGNFESLNRRIYDRLFLTPRSDPWLGLADDDTFSALQNDGVSIPVSPESASSEVRSVSQEN